MDLEITSSRQRSWLSSWICVLWSFWVPCTPPLLYHRFSTVTKWTEDCAYMWFYPHRSEVKWCLKNARESKSQVFWFWAVIVIKGDRYWANNFHILLKVSEKCFLHMKIHCLYFTFIFSIWFFHERMSHCCLLASNSSPFSLHGPRAEIAQITLSCQLFCLALSVGQC